MCTSRRRWTRAAACWAWSRSRRRRRATPSCTRGCRRSARSAGSGWKAPARTARVWPAHLRGRGLEVIEVDRPNRQLRRRAGKSDTVDAIEAARAALSGRASGIAKTADGNVEAIRVLLIAKRSARDTRIKCLNQIRHLGFTAPDELRERLRGVSRAAWPAPRPRCDPPPARSRRVRDRSSRSRPSGRRVARSRRRHATTRRPARRARARHRARACSRSTVSGSTPPRSCSSPPATTRNGSAAKPRSRTSAASHPSKRPRARPSGIVSTAAGTAKPTMRCGASCSPA